MFSISREGRAREDEQEWRLEAMHVGLTEFLKKCDPAHLITSRHLDVPTASTPYTPSTPTGIPSRLRPDFEFQPSPVGQDEPTEPARSTNSRTRDHDDIRNTRTRDHDDIRDTLTRDHDDIRSTRTRDHDDIRDTRTRDHNDIRDTRIREHNNARDTRTRDLHDDRDRGRDHRFNERPTHEDDRGDSGDMQRNVTPFLEPQSSDVRWDYISTVPSMDYPIRGHCAPPRLDIRRTDGTLPAANLLIGMTLGQLDDYNFLRARLSRRYDPPEREEAHRSELRACMRRRNESADEFAENIKSLAQRAYPSADQNMLDNLVVERFREGHGNEELKKTLMSIPLNRTTGPYRRVRAI